VARYLGLEGPERGANLDRFLATLSEEVRETCRERVEEALRAREALRAMRPAAAAPPPGEGTIAAAPRIPGFSVRQVLGRGGIGTVYLAWDDSLQREVALKVIHRGAPEAVRARILDEARKTAALRDRAIVTVHAVVEGEARGAGESAAAIVMERVEGFPIDRAAAKLSPAQKARILQETARALAVAHERGIIHRDLKPDNVLVSPELDVKILDFGLAVFAEDAGATDALFRGTPAYASPEQARGEPLTPASDVFSLGSLAFKVLTGQPPYRGDSVHDVLDAVAEADPPFPRDVAEGVPEDLQAICLASMARRPQDRPTAAEVAEDLGRFLAGEPVRLRPALYGDLLRSSIARHSRELHSWRKQRMISTVEHDRLEAVYRRILADEDHWIVDARRISLAQTVLYSGSWAVVVAVGLLVWLAREDLGPLARWLVPSLFTGVLVAVGLVAQARRDFLAAASFLAAGVLSIVPTLLSALGELGVAELRPEGTEQLIETFSNSQVLLANAGGLLLSLMAFRALRLTGFAWTTAALATSSYIAILLTRGWLSRPPETQAFWCLPLVALEAPALLFEGRGRVRWAAPFHLTALAALVLAPDVMASEGPTLKMLGVVPSTAPGAFLDSSRLESYSFAINGFAFLAVMLILERARSLDLRRGARVLEVLAPVHLLGALYASARAHAKDDLVLLDVAIYVAALLAILALGTLRERWRFLIVSLGGIALGSHLVIDIGLLDRVPFLLALGAAGLLVAAGTYAYFVARSRVGERPRKGGSAA
jgi:serine/threonine protein kinase